MSLQHVLGTQLNFILVYHLETDGKTDRVNKILEDMLQMYVMSTVLLGVLPVFGGFCIQ